MGLELYTIEGGVDNFQLDEYTERELSFPCCDCRFRKRKDTDEPCKSCGHNVNAEEAL